MNPVSENVIGPTVRGQVKRPHSHLCPDCNQLHQCVCEYGWRVAFQPCGCMKKYDAGDFYDTPGRVEFGD